MIEEISQRFRRVHWFMIFWMSSALVLFLLGAAFFLMEASNRKKAYVRKSIHQVETACIISRQILRGVSSDLAILARDPDMGAFLEDPLGPAGKGLAQQMVALATFKKRYDQVRVIGADGWELLRLDLNGTEIRLVPPKDLQNKKSRYYFQEIMDSAPDTLFISPLDLNVERGRIEIPFNPTIRYGLPLVDHQGQKKGMIVLNFRAGFMLEQMRAILGECQAQGMLVNEEGYWLLSPNPEDEWGFMFPNKKDKTFGRRFPEAWAEISSRQRGHVLSREGLFVFDTVEASGVRGQADSKTPDQAGETVSIPIPEVSWKCILFAPSDRLDELAGIHKGRIFLFGGLLMVVVTWLSWVLSGIILERQKNNEALAASEKRFQALASSLKLFPWESDPRGRFTYLNPVVEEVLGFSPAELTGLAPQDLPDPENGEEASSQMEDLFRQEKPFWDLVIRVQKKNGAFVALATSGFPIRDSENRVIGFRGVSRDVTARWNTENKLKRTESLARALLEANQFAAYLMDPQGIILAANQAGADRVGVKPEELEGQNMDVFFPPELVETWRLGLKNVFQFQEAIQFVEKIGEVYYEDTVFPIQDEGGRVHRLGIFSRNVTEARQIQEKLLKGEADLARAQDIARMGNLTWDIPDSRVVYSSGFCRLLEVNPEDLGSGYEGFLSLVHPDDRDRVKKALAAAIFEEQAFDMEYRMVRPYGSTIMVHSVADVVFELDEPIQAIVTIQDVSARAEAERELRIKESAVQTSINAIFLTDFEGAIEYVNRAGQEMWAASADTLVGDALAGLFLHRDQGRQAVHTVRTVGEWFGEIEVKKKDGEVFWVQISGSLTLDHQALPLCMMFSMVDITEQKKAEELLRNQAIRDTLTGLYNRRHLMEILEKTAPASKRHGFPLTLVMVDLDHFKAVNDTHGHRVGDRVLAGFGRLLAEALRAEDTAGRFGGEEFLLVLPQTTETEAVVLLERIRTRLTGTGFLGEKDQEFFVTASFGVAGMKPEDPSFLEPLERADQALYQAKDEGRNRVVVHAG